MNFKILTTQRKSQTMHKFEKMARKKLISAWQAKVLKSKVSQGITEYCVMWVCKESQDRNPSGKKHWPAVYLNRWRDLTFIKGVLSHRVKALLKLGHSYHIIFSFRAMYGQSAILIIIYSLFRAIYGQFVAICYIYMSSQPGGLNMCRAELPTSRYTS